MLQDSKPIRILKILLHITFFVCGITTILIGQVLPFLAERFSLNDLQAGFMFPAQFSGSLIGTFLTSKFGKRNKFSLATLIGICLMGLGILGLNLPFELCLVAFFLNGIGVGLTLPSINMLIYELNPTRASSAVNILNFVWGVGAIICSLTVYSVSKAIGFFPISIVLSAILFAIAIGLWLLPSNLEEKPVATDDDSIDFSVPIWTNPIAWLIAGFNFIHVGFETSMGGWLPTYTERLVGKSFEWWLAPTFIFFLLFVVGRGVAPIFLRLMDEMKMLILSVITMLFGLIILLISKDLLMLCLGSAIAGFGTSSVFPNNMSRFTKTFGASASRRATPFFIAGTLGATFTTQVIGYTSNYFNSLNSGMFILLGSVIILLILQVILMFPKLQKN